MRSLKLFSETFTKREHGYRNEAFKCLGRILIENEIDVVLKKENHLN